MFWRRRKERDLENEIRSHLELEARERVDEGESPERASLAARRAFGSVAGIREETRETWGWAALDRFGDDLRYGARMLRRTPGWTAVMGGTLALGIGLTTAIFSLVYSVLLQPLPYREPQRLVALWTTSSDPSLPRFNVNAASWIHWREQARSFEDIALTRPIANFNLTGDGAPERLQGARTSGNLPGVLGMLPLIGRTFTEEERQRDAKVALISYRLWERRFGRDAGILGRKIQLNGTPFEVIGVMPPAFRYPTGDFELWTPLYFPPDEIHEGIGYDYFAVARLKPGVAVAQAQAEMSALMRHLNEQYPAAHDRTGMHGAAVEPLIETTVGRVRSTLYLLLAAVGSLLLIGCVNLSTLLLARASARSREMALRSALGASGARLSRQLLIEILPLSLAGAAGGLLLAHWLLAALLPWLPPQMPRVESIGLAAWVPAFAVALSIVVVLLAGILPARLATKVNLAAALQSGSRTVAGGGRLRNLLVGAQVALTLVLVFGGGLLIRSLFAVAQVNPGFATDGVLTMHLAITRARYPEDRQVAEYCRRLVDRVRTVPGVKAAGMVNRLPLSGIAQTGPIEFEGRPDAGIWNTDWRSATPGYFSAIGIPLLRGHAFSEQDRDGGRLVGVIDEQLARQVFGAADPVGQRFRYSAADLRGPWVEIVGVAGHIRNDGLEQDPRPQVYWPLTQRTQDREVLVVRTAGRPETFAAAVVEQIRRENPEQPVYDVRSMREWLGRSLQSRDLLTALVALFGGASLLLACLGLYGVVSYTARLRLREFGIRMALGADPRDIRGLVLGHAAKLAMWGVAAGAVLAWPAGRALRTLLYGVGATDALTMAAAPALLLAVALLAGLAPARRAAKADPAITLRGE